MNCKEHLLFVGSNFFSILNTEVGYHTVEWVFFFLSSQRHFFPPVLISYRLNSHDERAVSKCIQKQFSFVWCQMLLWAINLCRFLLKIITKELRHAKSGQLHKVLCQKCQSAVLSDAYGPLDVLMWPAWKIQIFQKWAFKTFVYSQEE